MILSCDKTKKTILVSKFYLSFIFNTFTFYCFNSFMTLKEGELHIWRYTLDEAEYQAEKVLPLLSKEEQERCAEYLNEAKKIRYTCNHRFVRQVLAKYLHVEPSHIIFSKASMGKPFIEGVDLYFSYSYRTTFCLLAISKQREVGIDIEKIKVLQDPPTFASFSFSEEERKIIFDSPEDSFQNTLFTFWTFKEAIIKALGVGLNADLTKIDLSGFLYKEFNPLAFDNNAAYTMKQIKAIENYKAAFAIKGELKAYKEFNFNETMRAKTIPEN